MRQLQWRQRFAARFGSGRQLAEHIEVPPFSCRLWVRLISIRQNSFFHDPTYTRLTALHLPKERYSTTRVIEVALCSQIGNRKDNPGICKP